MKQHSFHTSLPPVTVECEAENIAMGDGNAFGRASGSRSEHHIRKLVRIDRDIGIAIILRRQRNIVINHDDLTVTQPAFCGGTVEEKHGRACLFHEQTHALQRIGGVQGQISATSFQYGKRGNHHVHGAFHEDGHRGFRFYTGFYEPVRKTVGPIMQLSVSQLRLRRPNSNGISRLCHLHGKAAWNGLRGGIRYGSVIPLCNNLLLLTIAEQNEVIQPLVRISRGLLEQTLEVQQHPLAGGMQEEIDKIIKNDYSVLGVIVHSQINVQPA